MSKRVSVLIVVLFGLAELPARAQTSGLVIAEGSGKLVDALIAAGYGNLNLYQTLVQIVKDTNPSVAGVITPAWLATLRSCSASSTIFTNTLSSYAGSGVVIYTNCTAQATGLQGSGFNGLAGSTTLATSISDLGSAANAAVVSLSPAYTLDSTHSVFAVIYAPQGTSQSFVLSDEAPGHLITNLVAAGYGSFPALESWPHPGPVPGALGRPAVRLQRFRDFYRREDQHPGPSAHPCFPAACSRAPRAR